MPLVHCHTACRLLAGLARAATLGLAAGAGEAAAQSQSRIKDVADFEGVRDNLLVGYGLVVGLNGTGDDLDSAVFTRESLLGMLQRLGINARSEDLASDNVAAVMVHAGRPPFSPLGTRRTPQECALGAASGPLRDRK